MLVQRFSSRRQRLYDSFLKERLTGAVSYDRIAGYFLSSLLDLAAEELREIKHVRIICNTDVSAGDVQAVRMATGARRHELEESLLRLVWNKCQFPHLVDVNGRPAQKRLQTLFDLISSDTRNERTFEIRIVPDSEFGFIHGKGGVIRYPDGHSTSFIGSANDSRSAWKTQYELVWEDASEESVAWVQEEFDALWERAYPLSEYIVKQIGRLGERTVIEHVGKWRGEPKPETVLAETPTITELFGFWEHQKYFISLAFLEHIRYRGNPLRGARYLLADGVGLGKTIQLGAIAKLIGTLEEKLPILIMAPKPLLQQWQTELMAKLQVPSAYWDNGTWITERNEVHPALPDTPLNCPRKVGIVGISAITSATRSPANKRLVEALLKKRFSCVIWDEAHKIRRENLREPNVFGPPEKNSLYEWAEKLAAQCQTMILATATPIQLHPMELWDMLHILSINNPHVLGSEMSRWRDANGPRIFDIISGREVVRDLYSKWDFLRDPLPRETNSDTAVFRHVRNVLAVADTVESASRADLDRIDPMDTQEIDLLDLREINPFTSRVVKRSRDRLEQEGKLVPIGMVAVKDAPILCSHSMSEAMDLAEQFARCLHKRMPLSGFIKTLLQRRVSSSMEAGLKTTRKMLLQDEISGDEDPEEEGALYPLYPDELEILRILEAHLARQLEREGDPKFDRTLDILRSDFEGISWLDRGTLIFSQFYDSAYALCAFLAKHIDVPIGLYTNVAASKLFEDGKAQPVPRELLYKKTQAGCLKLLVGTDAASTGLNLQELGCLINLDLPWNPTILEQRKGRVQRGTISKRVPFYNMRYDRGAEDRLYSVLSTRIQEITAIFGTVPDFIVDDWVKAMLEDRQWDETTLVTLISDRKKNPFSLKESTESLKDDWDSTVEVLNQQEALEQFTGGWK